TGGRAHDWTCRPPLSPCDTPGPVGAACPRCAAPTGEPGRGRGTLRSWQRAADGCGAGGGAATASTGAPHPRPTPRAGPDCSHDPPDTDEADEQEPLGQRKGEFSLPGGRRQRETQQGPGSTAGERPRQKGPPLPLVAAPASPGPQTTSGRPAPLPGTATGRAREIGRASRRQ